MRYIATPCWPWSSNCAGDWLACCSPSRSPGKLCAFLLRQGTARHHSFPRSFLQLLQGLCGELWEPFMLCWDWSLESRSQKLFDGGRSMRVSTTGPDLAAAHSTLPWRNLPEIVAGPTPAILPRRSTMTAEERI